MQVRESETQWITARELAGTLKIARDSIYRMTRDGRIPCVHAGRAVRYDLAAVVAALAAAPTNGTEVAK